MKKRLIFAVAVLAVFFSVPAQAQQVAVPNVVGMPADQAIKTIQSLGLRAPVTVEGMTPDQKQAGKITKQNPSPGQKVAAGGAVTLFTVMYQAAPVKVTVAPNVMAAFGPVMPNVVGMTFPQAYDAFKKAGLDFEKYRSRYTWRNDSTDPKCDRPVRRQPDPCARDAGQAGYSHGARFHQILAHGNCSGSQELDGRCRHAEAQGLHLGFSSKPTDTARPELNGIVYGQSPAPGTKFRTGGAGNSVMIQSYLYKESALEVKAQFMAEAKTYLLMVRGGALPYDVVASYDVPKSMAGQKIVKITPLTDSPGSPGWKLYRITNLIPIEAVMVVTDAKGRKHNYKLHLTQANK